MPAEPTLLSADWRPSTFVERGLAAPFTSPLLSQARLRPSSGGQIELVLPNPAGGRGFYVMGLVNVGEFVRLTVHDRLLVEELGKLQAITPTTVRRAARATAVRGSAGRLAAEAAALAVRREEEERLLCNVLLIVRLTRQMGHPDLDVGALSRTDESGRHQVRRHLAQMAPSFRLTPKELVDVLETLSRAVAPVGFRSGEFDSQAHRALRALDDFVPRIRVWAQLETGASREAADLLLSCADFTREAAKTALDDAWSLTGDAAGLLRAWLHDNVKVSSRLGLPDWLLDGWLHICELWAGAAEEDRPVQRSVFETIQGLIPVLPRECARWEDGRQGPDVRLLSLRRWVRLYEDWRTGEVLTGGAIQLNENARAACL